MALSDFYTGIVSPTLAATTATACCSVVAGTTVRLWITGIRVEVGQTTGSAWTEYPPTLMEWQVPAIANAAANSGLHVFCTPTVVTSTPVTIDVVWSQ